MRPQAEVQEVGVSTHASAREATLLEARKEAKA